MGLIYSNSEDMLASIVLGVDTHNSHHDHIMRAKTSEIASNPQNVKSDLGQDSYFHT